MSLNFPLTPVDNEIHQDPTNTYWRWDDTHKTWKRLLGVPGVEEAPEDNTPYQRQDATWVSPVQNPLTGYKNQIINGAMDVWQRATSGTGLVTYQSADRWELIGTLNRASNIFSAETGARYSGTTGTGNEFWTQKIEDHYQFIPGAKWTFSFYDNIPSGNGISLSFEGGASATIDSTEVIGSRQIYHVTIPARPGGETYFNVQLNNNDATSHARTDIQFEKGSVATEFERRPYQLELMLCQRYYWTQVGNVSRMFLRFSSANSLARSATIWFPVQMRANPSITIVMSSSSGAVSDASVSYIRLTCTANATTSNVLISTAKADAEL